VIGIEDARYKLEDLQHSNFKYKETAVDIHSSAYSFSPYTQHPEVVSKWSHAEND
jgi:hypothetical protein